MPSINFSNEKKKVVKGQSFVGKKSSSVSWTVNGMAPPAGFKTEPSIKGGLLFGFVVSFPVNTTASVEWSVS